MPKHDDDEDWQNEIRQLRAEEREDRKGLRFEDYMPDPCECGGKWFLTEESTYGDDADGNRGVPLLVWECGSCRNELETIVR